VTLRGAAFPASLVLRVIKRHTNTFLTIKKESEETSLVGQMQTTANYILNKIAKTKKQEIFCG